MTQVDARAPPGQPCHLAQAADLAEVRDLPQIPCHGHLDLLAWISGLDAPFAVRQVVSRLSVPWRASLPGLCKGRVSLWEQGIPFGSRLWTTGLRRGR
ncbi:hypothetical protein GCM10022403_027520 [Streptomyces coacervatus]|uniref:Uncharacterized protein n=1 Tax=Streptomyces coacervatus TaxID=647381 RepID=A0ABP7HFE0_9ACTN